MSQPYDPIVNILINTAPKTTLDGNPITDPTQYELGTLTDSIDKAVRAGKTPQQIADAIAAMVRQGGWTHATGEYADQDLLEALGLKKASGGSSRKVLTPAEIKEQASNGANRNEAENGNVFFGYDGKNHRIEDADYEAQRAAFLAVPYTPPVPPTNAPGDTTPTGGFPGDGTKP